MELGTKEVGGLVERIQRGDQDAEIRLYEYFGPRIQFLARRELRSFGLAEDVRSEALIRAVAAIRKGRLRTADALPAFVLQTARNVIHEFRRREQRVVTGSDGVIPELAVDPAPVQDDGALRALRRALTQLNARDRLFLRLHFVDELSRPEIARRLNIDEARVRLVKSRALQRIRDAFGRLTDPNNSMSR